MLFPVVLLNIGDAFNASTSLFICPYDGVYEFHFHVDNQANERCLGELIHNGNVQLSARGHSDGSATAQASNTVYLECNTLDQVWVEGEGECYSNTFRYTSFSGHYIGPRNVTSKIDDKNL